MSESFTKPVPNPSPDTQPYWDGLAAGKLLIQRCTACGTLRHYPRPVCDRCWSMAHEWVPASGQGTVQSWTVCHHPFHMGFKAESPYVLLTVDLAEGVRAMGQLRGLPADALRLGLPVVLGFEQGPGGPVLPVFHPRTE
jgi:uncharacterized OB-fold protein